VLRVVWHRSAADVTVGTLASSYVNAGNLGLPLAVYLLGDAVAVVPTLLFQLLVLAPLAFAVLDAATGEVRGSTSFYDWEPRMARVEIGHTYYARRWWGTSNNPACKLLMLRHAFETWGCVRVALRADARNARSIAAITRLGATPEGVLRSHRVAPDGSRGDTAYFSILADEWPAVRDGLLARLARTPADA